MPIEQKLPKGVVDVTHTEIEWFHGKRDDRNPNKMTKTELRELRSSLAKFGQVQPIVFNQRTELVVGGHQKIEEAKRAGLTHLTVWHVDLDDHDAMQLNLALNHISGSPDAKKMTKFVETLAVEVPEIDWEVTGLSIAEVEKLIGDPPAPPPPLAAKNTTVICPHCASEFTIGEGNGAD